MAAIYQWFVGDIEVLTTTLYPIEVQEGLNFTIDLDYGNMRNVDNDDYIFAGGGFEDAYSTPILLTGPEPNDDYIMSYGFDDAYPEDKLVIAYTPDQGLIFTVDLDSANCSMIDA
jgi:hypothetical protein